MKANPMTPKKYRTWMQRCGGKARLSEQIAGKIVGAARKETPPTLLRWYRCESCGMCHLTSKKVKRNPTPTPKKG